MSTGTLLAEGADADTGAGFDPETDPASCDPAVRETFLDDVACQIDSNFGVVADWFGSIIFWGPEYDGQGILLVVVWSVLAAIGFTIYFKGVQFTGFKTALEVVRGKYSRADDPGEVPTSRP
ncbi:hypothetical protein [Nesterenkonia pannonica]|uniref:hypothetical protein n=1 Tax=Nesterenkonia pannonica TaxID=1548602 RepID=UPI0021641B81|nr:hypothetical protein [Nesterenkonia pannonica]